MDRDAMIEKVEVLYRGRATGDQSEFPNVLHPEATFRFAGEQSIIDEFPGGKTEQPDEVAQALFDQIEMLSREQIDAVAQGNKLAIRFATRLCVKGGEPFDQELFDLWEFDENGQILRGTQYQDTAKIITEMRAAKGPAS